MARIYHGFVSKPPENKMESGPTEVKGKKRPETEPKKETQTKKNKE